MKLGSTDISKVYLGSTEVTKAYLGDTLVHGSEIPIQPYDAEIEYIETTVGANSARTNTYIDTGVYPTEKTSIDMKIYVPTYVDGGDSHYFFGELENSKRFAFYNAVNGTNSSRFYRGASNATATSRIPNDNIVYLNSTQETTKIHVTWEPDESKTYNAGAVSAFTSSYSLILLAVRNGTTSIYAAGGRPYTKLYYCKIYEDGVLIRDYIPVRVGQVGYLYDKVNGTLTGSAGTGSFTLGSDVG